MQSEIGQWVLASDMMLRCSRWNRSAASRSKAIIQYVLKSLLKRRKQGRVEIPLPLTLRCARLMNSTSRADCRTVQGGGSAREIELPLHRPALQETIDKPGVEDITSPRGVYRLDAIGSCIMKLPAVPRQHAVVA